MSPPLSLRPRSPRVTRLIRAALLGALLIGAPLAQAESTAKGGRVAWGRMIARGDWDIHSDRDPSLASFIRRNTSLNIDPTWYSVAPSDLTALSRYPFLYVKSLTNVPSRTELANIREYLARGGFLCIDPCMAHQSRTVMYESNRRILLDLIPGAEIRPLRGTEPVFHSYFDVTVADLFTTDMRLGVPTDDLFFGVYHADRMVAVISLAGLECGWPQTPMRTNGCMKMIVNIYVNAMTQAAPPPVKIQ